MEDSIKTTRVDVNKVKNLFDEILTYILDYRHEQDYARQRVELVDEIFKLTQEVIEVMYRTEMQFATECSKEDLIDIINVYRNAEHNLCELQGRTDALMS